MASLHRSDPADQPRRKARPAYGVIAMVAVIVLALFGVLVVYVANHGITSAPEGGVLNRSQAEQNNPKAP